MKVLLGFWLLIGLMPVVSSAAAPLPVIPKAPADHCVEPTDVMRRNHMNLILHQRDNTMHRGIRTKKYSLKACIDCHVQPDDKGQYPSVKTKDHFCNACHSYAAVSIDCFQCHSDKPEKATERVSGNINEEPRHGQ
ncbi:MAG TPA: sulfur reduction protein DsrJ [Gammaproteobacteria bacterium]|nr:sulfur reduction protein DsrJ [Gammaproteobacteria bacterium]